MPTRIGKTSLGSEGGVMQLFGVVCLDLLSAEFDNRQDLFANIQVVT